MLCEVCQENEAAVHLTQVADGSVKKLHLCQQCAAQSGLNIDSALSLTDVLFGMGLPDETDAGGPEKSCPACHMRRADFRKTSRLGCPACYETFAEELDALLGTMHRGRTHAGKIPASAARVMADPKPLSELRSQLEQAISNEQYEEAARLRDLIRKLQSARVPPPDDVAAGAER